MAGRRIATPDRTAPVLLALTLRRHIDLARVSSAACR
ncbi:MULTISPECIES: putative leader peptide [unclassified Streptomyces]